MHVLNTLIWTTIYSALIYRKNVVYCTETSTALTGQPSTDQGSTNQLDHKGLKLFAKDDNGNKVDLDSSLYEAKLLFRDKNILVFNLNKNSNCFSIEVENKVIWSLDNNETPKNDNNQKEYPVKVHYTPSKVNEYHTFLNLKFTPSKLVFIYFNTLHLSYIFLDKEWKLILNNEIESNSSIIISEQTVDLDKHTNYQSTTTTPQPIGNLYPDGAASSLVPEISKPAEKATPTSPPIGNLYPLSSSSSFVFDKPDQSKPAQQPATHVPEPKTQSQPDSTTVSQSTDSSLPKSEGVTSPSTDSSSLPPATPASQSSPASGTTTTTTSPKTTDSPSSTKVVVDNQVVDNGRGCTCKNFWYGLLTCGIYNCVKNCQSKSQSGPDSNSPDNKGAIELDISKKQATSDYYRHDGYYNVIFYGKDKIKFKSIKDGNTLIWSTKDPKEYAISAFLNEYGLTIRLENGIIKNFIKNEGCCPSWRWVWIILTCGIYYCCAKGEWKENYSTSIKEEHKITSPSDNKVVIDNQVVDNGCGCTCRNFWYGLLTCGLYNCFKYYISPSKVPLIVIPPSKKSKVTGVELNLKCKKSTSKFDYKKKGNVTTYTAKPKHGFSSIKGEHRECCGSGCLGGCCGSGCCNTIVMTIWEAANEREYATEVKLYHDKCKLKHIEIHNSLGDHTICVEHDIAY